MKINLKFLIQLYLTKEDHMYLKKLKQNQRYLKNIMMK